MTKRTRILLILLLFLLPLTMRLATRVLVWQGDTRDHRRTQALAHFAEEDLAAGLEYTRAFQPGGALASVVYWALLAWMVFASPTRRLVDWAVARGRGWLWLELLIVMVPLFLLLRLVLLPIGYYHGFVLEGQFGFRRQTFLEWIVRVWKGWGVAFAQQYLIALGFFILVRRFRRWDVGAMLGAGAFSYVAIIAYPLLVLPLFYSIEPVPDGELRNGIESLSERAGVPVSDIQLVDQSRVSSHTNAFFVGIGGRRSIYLYDTLLEQHDVPEVLSVVAHEIGHWRHRHMLKGWALGVLGAALGFMLLRRFLNSDDVLDACRLGEAGDLAFVPLGWALFAAVSLYISPIESGISRHFELQADNAALDLMQTPSVFIDMKTSSAQANRRNLLPHPAIVFWYASHPPVVDRIANAESRLE